MRHLRLTPILLLLAVTSPAQAEAEEVTVRRGAWFEVVCHFEHDRVADDALAAVEAIGPVAKKLYGLRPPPKGEPLKVHLYRTIADYEAAEHELTGGKFKRNLAFAHHESRSAHVALQPPVSEEVLDRLGLPYLTQNLLAHEAAHIVRFRAMPSFRSHPRWLIDGAAIWIALQAELTRKRITRLESNPTSSTEIGHGQRLLANERLPSVEDIFRGRTEDLSFYERYATHWLLFQFLVTCPHAGGFGKVMRKLRHLGGGDGFAERLMTRIVTATVTTEKLDAAFRDWVRALQPKWREVIRSLDTNGNPWVQAAFPKSNAIAWRTKPEPGDYELTGWLEILPGPNVQMNILLDKTEKGFVSIALRSDGWVTLFEYDSANDHWNRRSSVECEAMKGKGKVPFVVRAKERKVAVFIEGAEVSHTEFAKRELRGPWGLGAQAGTCGLWHEVTVKTVSDTGSPVR